MDEQKTEKIDESNVENVENVEEAATPEQPEKKERVCLAVPVFLVILFLCITGGWLIGRQIERGKEAEGTVQGVVTEGPTGTLTPTSAPEGTLTPTNAPEGTLTPTDTPEGTLTPTDTPEGTLTPTQGQTGTLLPTKKPTSTPKPTSKPENTPTPGSDSVGTPVAQHGALSVKGAKLVDKNGDVYQLRGVSTHGLQWFPQYVNKAAFQTLRDEWNCNVVRLAMYTAESGYCEGANKTEMKKLVKNGVNYATELGLYVIIDWHVLNDRDPNKYKSEAIAFFEEMAKEYKNHVNVIYEICNEPNGGVGWSSIKSYAEDVISAIRAIDTDAVIIVGTPNWSQQVDEAAADPITGEKNIMYALHFYAGTHKDDLRNKMIRAAKAGLPIFCSEFGISDASGNGSLDIESGNKWIAVMDELDISYVCWNLANKSESSSLLKSSCKKTAGWAENEISEQGKWLIQVLKGTLEGLGNIDGEELVENAENGGTGQAADVPEAISYEKTSGGFRIQIDANNTWSSADGCFYQLAPVLLNQKGSAVSDWKLTVVFDQEISVTECWGCETSVSGKTLTITPLSYTANIENGTTMNNLGLIISAKQEVTIRQASCE